MIRIHRRFSLAAFGLLLVFGFCAAAHGQSTLIGDWDFVLRGRQRGVAHITFSDDGTLSGRAVHTFIQKRRNDSDDVATNVFGGAELQGSWSFQSGSDKRIVGFINFISASSGMAAFGLSFRGVASDTRLTLQTRGSAGTVTFRGMPLAAGPDLSGAYYGKGRTRDVRRSFVEIFTLSPMTNGTSALPNGYSAIGGGPGYEYEGWFLVSGFGYGALYQNRDAEEESMAAFAGRFRAETGRGTLVGTDGVSRNIRLSISHGP